MNNYQLGQESTRLNLWALVLPGWFFLFSLTACESALMREFNHHMAGNDQQTAQRIVQQELSRDGQNPEANYLMGNLLSQQKQYNEANIYFDRSLNRSSVYREHIRFLKERNFRMEFNRGVELYQTDQFSRAAEHFELALQIYPNHNEVFPQLGKIYEELGRNDDAETAYRSCIENDPSHLECGLSLSSLLYENRRFEEAAQIAEQVSRHYPEDWRGYRLQTDARLAARQFDRAETAFEELYSRARSYRHIKHFALTLYNEREIRRAEPFLVRCLEQRPNDPEVLQVLAGIYLDSGNYGLVIDAGNRVLNSDPNNNSIKAKMMIAYELLGDIDRFKEIKQELGLREE